MRPVPVDSQRLDWPRLVANAINYLLARGPQTGDVRYDSGTLQYWDGDSWNPVP